MFNSVCTRFLNMREANLYLTWKLHQSAPETYCKVSRINNNINSDCEHKMNKLQAELDGLRRELAAKDKIIELLERNASKK